MLKIITKEYTAKEKMVCVKTIGGTKVYVYEKISYFKVNGKWYERTQTFTKVVK